MHEKILVHLLLTFGEVFTFVQYEASGMQLCIMSAGVYNLVSGVWGIGFEYWNEQLTAISLTPEQLLHSGSILVQGLAEGDAATEVEQTDSCAQH